MIQQVRGTHDMLDLSLYNFIISTITEHLHNYNFHEIKTPILEYTQLFKRTLGLETDIVTKEMFLIAGRDDEDSICLRPEATAPTMRAYIEHTIEQQPWKVFSHGAMFRHERPQKGRLREFHQVNIEVIGTHSIAQDAQFIKMLDRLFHEQLNLDTYALIINFLGTFDDRQCFKETLRTFLNNHIQDICEQCLTRKDLNILRIFDCKNENCQALYQNAPSIIDSLAEESRREWSQLQEQLYLLSVSFTHKPTLVRGLDYYDKTVFEFVSPNLGAQQAFCGGGRYNRLAKELGAKEDFPSLGCSIGLERLLLLLEPLKDKLTLPQPPSLHIIIPTSPEQESLALLLADTLQAHKLVSDVLFDGSIKSRMRKANKMAASYVLIIGPEEQAEHAVTIKNMTTGQEEKIKQIDVVEYIKK